MLEIMDLTLLAVMGTLAAIIYAMRILVLVERRIARIELHLEKMTSRVLKEEININRKLSKRRR
ncbi:MAG: hypothetical protein V1740_07105 [Candidatus Woesearchaeota archaeon]